jgi:tRNA modification GTPase
MDTIYALSSAPGRAGIAVIRVSGSAARAVYTAVVGDEPVRFRARVRTLRDPATGDALDQAIVLWFPGPASFTGEDVLELHTHGGVAVVRAVCAAIGHVAGCRPAEPGEFARRAFEAGKIDLTAAEGLADLIDAETENQRRQAFRQSTGALAALYEGWREQLLDAQALAEAAIDFSDEGDVAASASSEALSAARQLYDSMLRHLGDARRGEILRDGVRVVLAGPPNVGKSSLLNALARRDVAIVSPEAGTTRDVIEVRLDLNGTPVILSDTAGLRAEASGAIEHEGMRRTRERAGQADVVILVRDAAAVTSNRPVVADDLAEFALGGEPTRIVLSVLNKADLLPSGIETGPGHYRVSALTGAGLDQFVSALAATVAACSGAGDALSPTSARHRFHLERALAALAELGPHLSPELVAENLRGASAALGRITGRVDPEAVLDRIFGRFCIGK